MKLQNTPELNPGQGDQQTPYNTGPATPGAPGIGVPAGGTSGQVLTKSSNADFATGWTTPSTAPLVTINTQVISAYTVTAADCSPNTPTLVRMNSGSANTLVFPLNATTAIPIGSVVGWMQYGTGQTTLTPGTSGVTLRTSGSLTSRALYASGTATKIATDEWLIEGDTT